MGIAYRQAMGWLERLCLLICVVAVACMTVLIFVGVVMRYGFSVGAQFAEPVSIYFAIHLTFYGAAACYRAGVHLKLEFVIKALPHPLSDWSRWATHGLMGFIAAFMVIYGLKLVETTWGQSYPEFTAIRVGWVYTAIPISGLITLLFVLEAVFLPPRSEAPADSGLSSE